MKPALLYVLVAVVFIGVYYAWLSDDIQELRTAYIETFNEGIKDENNLNNFLSQHPEEKGKSVDELMQKNRENVERNVSVQTRIMGGSLALTFIAIAYGLLAVFFWRTFVRKW
jgi:predicted PurR-regulated permease PerM